jgi:hypothetical protein
MFGVQAFGLESQYLVPTILSSKTTLTMPPRRVSQRLTRSGEEIALLQSAQVLPHIDEGQETDASDNIEEGEQ